MCIRCNIFASHCHYSAASHLVCPGGDCHVQAVITADLLICPSSPPVVGGQQRLPLLRSGQIQNRGGAAGQSGARAAVEVIGGGRANAAISGRLLQSCQCVHSACGDGKVRSVVFFIKLFTPSL